MTHVANATISQIIDEICDSYEAALKSDSPLSIEDCLARVDAEHQPALFRELLEIELEYRSGTSPAINGGETALLFEPSTREQYDLRFPYYMEIIDKVFYQVRKPDRIASYEILEELGHGGMGIVYKARQDGLNRTVALKVLSESLLNDEQAVKRFQRETRLIGRLNHPNVVTAYDAGEIDSVHFIAMEYVSGLNLQEFVAQLTKNGEQLPLGVVCELVRQVALGLQHAHRSELVHRDIKPANLMLDYSGTVKILDLGLGKFFSEKRSEDSHVMTRIGVTMGTPDYMSPEQCQVAPLVDIRSDIYSLGCTFYYLATGHPPYHEERFDSLDKKMMGHIIGEIPSLLNEITDTPGELEEVFQKMLAKKPEQRFQTPQELADAIEPFADPMELRELLETWKLEHGITSDASTSGSSQEQPSSKRVGGKSTGRISAKSTKKQFLKRKARTFPHLARDWRVIAVLTLLLISVAALIPFLVPEKKTDPMLERAKLNLAQLPGLNGRWWFDEIPWFIPPVRERLMRKLDNKPDLLGTDLEKYFESDVAAVYQWLRGVTNEHLLNDLTAPQRTLVTTLMEFSNPENANADIEESLGAALAAFEAAHADGIWNAVDMHACANIKHQIAAKNEKLAENAVKLYAEVSILYDEELKTAERLYPLAVLARADALRIEYALVAERAEIGKTDTDYGELFEKFEKVCHADRDRPLGSLFEVEFRAQFGAYAAEAGEFKEAIKQFNLANKAMATCKIDNITDYPLHTHVTERHGWSLMDTWQVTEAKRLFKAALRYRENNSDHYSNNNNSEIDYATGYYIQHNEHALAMATRYGGSSVAAEIDYEKVQTNINTLIEKFKSDPKSTIAGRQILSNLNERAGNTRERRADCILYSGAASGTGRERFPEMAELYRQAGECYEPTSMKRVMHLKQAIMLMLIGGADLDEGEKILNCVIDKETQSPLSGNQVRYHLMRQLAEAVLALKKETGSSDVATLKEKRRPLEDFLKRFQGSAASDTTVKPISKIEAERRENQEMRLFAAELLLSDLMEHNENIQAIRDLTYLDTALVVFQNNPEIQAFKKRFDDLAQKVRELPISENH